LIFDLPSFRFAKANIGTRGRKGGDLNKVKMTQILKHEIPVQKKASTLQSVNSNRKNVASFCSVVALSVLLLL
jgi:hypothetical protein